jgi:hypothetical protein
MPHEAVKLGSHKPICEVRHSLRPAPPLNSSHRSQESEKAWEVFPVMTQEAAAEVAVRTQRERSDPLGIACLATIGIVMLAWIAGLVWAAIAFFNWLV